MERVSKADKKKLPKPNAAFNVPTDINSFFRWWCIFLRPFIKLTNREIDIISAFLRQRWELSKRIQDPAILDTLIMGDEVKKKVMEECNISLQHFYVTMSNLRKNGVIVNNSINPKLIPKIRPEDKGVFQLLILFKDDNMK